MAPFLLVLWGFWWVCLGKWVLSHCTGNTEKVYMTLFPPTVKPRAWSRADRVRNTHTQSQCGSEPIKCRNEAPTAVRPLQTHLETCLSRKLQSCLNSVWLYIFRHHFLCAATPSRFYDLRSERVCDFGQSC